MTTLALRVLTPIGGLRRILPAWCRAVVVVAGFLLSAGSLTAQTFYVFATNGTVEKQTSKGWKALTKAMPLEATDKIRTSRNGSLTILDTERRKVYAVQSVSPNTVSALLSAQQSKGRSYTKEAFAAMTTALFSANDVSMDAYRTKGGVTYRGDNIEDQLAAWLHATLMSNGSCYVTRQSGYYDVQLRLVSPSSRKTPKSVKVGESLYVQVVNNSDEALFVNLIDVDANKEWSVVLPMDAGGTMAYTLIPPHTTVQLPWPVDFYEPRGTDSLILLAANEPYNLQRVIDLYHANATDAHSVQAGLSIVSINIY